jgi:hypothetical protein
VPAWATEGQQEADRGTGVGVGARSAGRGYSDQQPTQAWMGRPIGRLFHSPCTVEYEHRGGSWIILEGEARRSMTPPATEPGPCRAPARGPPARPESLPGLDGDHGIPGEQSWLICAVGECRGRIGKPKGFHPDSSASERTPAQRPGSESPQSASIARSHRSDRLPGRVADVLRSRRAQDHRQGGSGLSPIANGTLSPQAVIVMTLALCRAVPAFPHAKPGTGRVRPTGLSLPPSPGTPNALRRCRPGWFGAAQRASRSARGGDGQ